MNAASIHLNKQYAQRGILWAALLVACLLLRSGATSGSDWIGGAEPWSDADNWSGGIPTTNTSARINNGGEARIYGDSVQAFNVILGGAPGESGRLAVFSIGGFGGELTIPAGSGGFLPGALVVGFGGSGVMQISGIGTVRDQNGFIGASNGVGTATVNGANAVWINNQQLSLNNGTLAIGGGGKVSNIDGSMESAGGRSTLVTVTGAGSRWTSTGNLQIGGTAGSVTGIYGGSDVLTIADSGLVSVGGAVGISPFGTVNVGTGSVAGALSASGVVNDGLLHFNHTGAATLSAPLTGAGRVFKDGTGSATINDAAGFAGDFTVNDGLLMVKNSQGATGFAANSGGTLRMESAVINLNGAGALRANGGGAIEYRSTTVNGGFLRGPGLHTVLAGGSCTFNGVTTFASTAIEQNGPAGFNNFTNGGALVCNETLRFDGAINGTSGDITVNGALIAQDFTNNGLLTVNDGGTLDNGANNLVSGGGSRTTINSGGQVFLSDGTSLELNGALLVNDGAINGVVNVNFGSLARGNGNYDVVNVGEGGAFAPGDSPGEAHISGNYGQSARGGLLIELGGTTPGSEFDRMAIDGAAVLDGKLDVVFVNDFVPAPGSAFEIIAAGGGVNGVFAEQRLPALDAGLAWNVAYDANSVTLTIDTAEFSADFNGDGEVDGVDLVQWTGDFGINADSDADADGDSDGDDLLAWQRQFGSPLAATATTAVPESASAALISFAAVGATLARTRRVAWRASTHFGK